MPAKIIVVSGYCATGKSTFAKRLSEQVNLPYLSKDTIKECLGDHIGSEQKGAVSKLSIATVALMTYLAEELIKATASFILEANFKPVEIDSFRNIIDKYDCECLTYLFKGDLHILYERYIERDPIRHWVHTQCTMTLDEFIAGQKILGEIEIGKMIHVDATVFSEVEYCFLIRQAQDFLKK